MKTAIEIINENNGFNKDNIVKIMQQYALQALEEYKNTILEKAEDICKIEVYYHTSDYEDQSGDEYDYATINEEKFNILPFPNLN